MEEYRSEFVIALSCAVGTDTEPVKECFEKELTKYNYRCRFIKISKDLLDPINERAGNAPRRTYDRSMELMDRGNEMRKNSNDCSILAAGAIHQIYNDRDDDEKSTEANPIKKPKDGLVYIIDSLKHPDEVKLLRAVYGTGFYLFAINEAEEYRRNNLCEVNNIGMEDADKLIQRDLEEHLPYGQKTRRVFELADFHLSVNRWMDFYQHNLPTSTSKKAKLEAKKNAKINVLEGQIKRILELLFGNPFITPTFDEYAMFMAYATGLRSADLSRQIGAVIATPQQEIVAMGANDCPQYGGGQYWMTWNPEKFAYEDVELGRDYKRGYDSNKAEFSRIVDEIVGLFKFDDSPEGTAEKEAARKKIYNSRIGQLTEYGRPMHAEMAAILSCARTGISLQDATLYCTTFPCHNCAKHIIGAGIRRVVYIEPYPKSKSFQMYSESISLGEETKATGQKKVSFEEFVGIGPRRFFDLFSMRLGNGYPLIRKNEQGNVVDWDCSNAKLRCIMEPTNYMERETFYSHHYLQYLDSMNDGGPEK